jgi:hypothetical protein
MTNDLILFKRGKRSSHFLTKFKVRGRNIKIIQAVFHRAQEVSECINIKLRMNIMMIS